MYSVSYDYSFPVPFVHRTQEPQCAFSEFMRHISTVLRSKAKTPKTKEEVQKTRLYTVDYTPNPRLIFRSKGLSELGFTVGNYFTLTPQAGQMIIRLAEGMR